MANLNACPFCRTDLPLDLQINRTIIQLGDLVKTSKDGVNNKCVFCQTHSKEVCFYCKQCNNHFCYGCGRQHEENVLFKEHTLVKLASNINVCNTHRRALTIYGVDCNVLLCILCEHQNSCCAKNNKKMVEDIHQDKSQELEQLIDKIASQIQFNTQKKIQWKTEKDRRRENENKDTYLQAKGTVKSERM